MGLTEDFFWHSNPRKLIPYNKAYQAKQFEIDRQMHRMGAYVYEAVGSALSGLGKKPHKYRDRPFLADEEEQLRIENMSKDERLREVEKIFKMLGGEER